MPRRGWTGRAHAGSSIPTAQETARVIAQMREHVGRSNRTTLDDLTAQTGVPGRTIRAILSVADGKDFLLVMTQSLLYVAEFQDEAEHTTRQLRSRARKMNARADRRDVLAQGLSRQQGSFFGDLDDDEEIDL